MALFLVNALFAVMWLTGCGDVNVSQSQNVNQTVSADQLAECDGDCEDEADKCPDCFDDEYLEFGGLTFAECLEFDPCAE